MSATIAKPTLAAPASTSQEPTFATKNANKFMYATGVLVIILIGIIWYMNSKKSEKKVKFEEPVKKANKEPTQKDIETAIKKDIKEVNDTN